MSVTYRHPHPDSQPQPQALPQPPQLLLAQPDLVLQLPLLHQQGGLHLHKVATGKQNKKIETCSWVMSLHCISEHIREAVPVVSVLLGGQAAAQHPADGLLSAVHVVLQVLSLGQLPHELTLLLQQG